MWMQHECTKQLIKLPRRYKKLLFFLNELAIIFMDYCNWDHWINKEGTKCNITLFASLSSFRRRRVTVNPDSPLEIEPFCLIQVLFNPYEWSVTWSMPLKRCRNRNYLWITIWSSFGLKKTSGTKEIYSDNWANISTELYFDRLHFGISFMCFLLLWWLPMLN